MTTYKFEQPADAAPQHAVDHVAAFVAAHGPLPTKQFDARVDHKHEYPATVAVDHTTAIARQLAHEVLALMPRVTKKEAQFAMGFHTPKDVTVAANAWAKGDEERPASDAHRVVRPAPFRPLAPEYRPAKAAKADAGNPEVAKAGDNDTPQEPVAPAKGRRGRKAAAA